MKKGGGGCRFEFYCGFEKRSVGGWGSRPWRQIGKALIFPPKGGLTTDITPTKRGGGGKSLTMLKVGYKKFWGSFYMVA